MEVEDERILSVLNGMRETGGEGVSRRDRSQDISP